MGYFGRSVASRRDRVAVQNVRARLRLVRARAGEVSLTRPCARCGAEFLPKSPGSEQRLCSRECVAEAKGAGRVGARIAIASLILLAAAAPAPGSADADLMAGHEAWITYQQTPTGNGPCCSLADGRPAELRLTPAGKYEVFYSREHWGPRAPDEWVPVPDEAILQQASPIFVPIVWIYQGRVRCVALPKSS